MSLTDPIRSAFAARPVGVPARALAAARYRAWPAATCPADATLLLLQTERALAGQGRGLPRRLVRVPLDAIAPIRSKPQTLLLAPARETLRLPPPAARVREAIATPIAARAARGTAAYMVREAMVLALFVATLAATYYLGRTHAVQNVIIVPEPWTKSSRVS